VLGETNLQSEAKAQTASWSEIGIAMKTIHETTRRSK